MAQQELSVVVSGITQTQRNVVIGTTNLKSNAFLWQMGVMGVSVTNFTATVGTKWAVEVYSLFGGVEFKVAGVTNLGSTTTEVLYILPNPLNGTSQFNFYGGIPTPTQVDIVGSSTAVGSTFGCVVTMRLQNNV